ncbi:MAG TPA: AlpA family phage regulatory protein [Thermoanaerobaculia bacterium]|nr:AlpA family phage regulatory protein [Thermoanaerobaculia bacterium]
MRGIPRYLSRREVLEILGISESSLKRAVRGGYVPRPVTLGSGRVGWRTDPALAGRARRAVHRQTRPPPRAERTSPCLKFKLKLEPERLSKSVGLSRCVSSARPPRTIFRRVGSTQADTRSASGLRPPAARSAKLS